MIIKQHLIEDENSYKKYNYFEVSKNLENILLDDYFLYQSKDFKNSQLVEDMYKKNFLDKYDRQKDKEIYALYIDNKKFEEKVKFIYSVVDYKKYIEFVAKNEEIKEPLEYTIKYSVLDSQGTKVEIYHISIVDISFVF